MNTLFVLLRMSDAETYAISHLAATVACAVLLFIIMFILIGMAVNISQTRRQNETIIKLLKEKNTENLKP